MHYSKYRMLMAAEFYAEADLDHDNFRGRGDF